MTTYVMTRLAISRHKSKNGIAPICRYCGEPIHVGDLCIRRIRGSRDKHTEYVHAKCDEKRRY